MKFQKKDLKKYINLTLILNFTSLIMGIIYLVIGPVIIFGILFGIELSISWFLNIGLIVLDDHYVVKSTQNGKNINRMEYCFLSVQIIATLFLIGGNFLMNAQWGSALTWYLLLSIGFFSVFVSGSVLTYINIKNIHVSEVWKLE